MDNGFFKMISRKFFWGGGDILRRCFAYGLCSVEWWDDRSVISWKGFGRKLGWSNRDTTPEFAWKDWGISWKTLISITAVPLEIITDHLHNTTHIKNLILPTNAFKLKDLAVHLNSIENQITANGTGLSRALPITRSYNPEHRIWRK